jgi:hypothetical protein
MPYHWNGADYEPYGHIGWVDVPAGDLRTSSSQLINFLTMFINNGTYNSQEILNSETVKMMLTPQQPFNQNLGLIWWKNTIGGRTVWGHGGSDYGARAQMHFHPHTKIGVVVLTNGESSPLQIVGKLFEYAENLPNNNPPTPPKINGPSSGKPGQEYEYSFVSTDPEGDAVMYLINWDDGDIEWTEYGDSGVELILKHTWGSSGKYTITAQAIDFNDASSEWSELTVTVPKNKVINKPFLNWLQDHPNLFQFLQKILQ